MPYDFTLIRLDNQDNETALTLNKELAQSLIDTYSEVYDPQDVHTPFHFTNVTIKKSNEYPELHFHLEAERGDHFFRFNFWKAYIIIELGAANQPDALFAQVRKYAEQIIPLGFKIEDPTDGSLTNIDNGIQAHIQAYRQWSGLVDQVVNYMNNGETNA